MLALDLVTQRQRQLMGGGVMPGYPPAVSVCRVEVRTLEQPMEQDVVETAGPPLPPSTHARRVGESGFDVDRHIGTAAMSGWSEDRAPLESRIAAEHEQRLWQRLFTEVAGQAAELCEMK